MSKYIVLIAIAFSAHCIFCFLHLAEARRAAGEGFCWSKISKRTGECKRTLGPRQPKVSCCSNGGAGWSSRKRGRDNCEPCRTIIAEPSYWSKWGDWSECNATCGPSFQERNRTCISHGGNPCRGRAVMTRSCQTKPCPIDGGWSVWGNWSSCSKTCGNGFQIRARSCTNPKPQYGGNFCQGQLQERRPCVETEHCPIHGGWGPWGEWSRCSVTCGLGKQTRDRKCDSPAPQYGGRPCNETERVEGRYCRVEEFCDRVRYSGSGSGWSSGSESGSGSGSGWISGDGDWETAKAWSDDEDI